MPLLLVADDHPLYRMALCQAARGLGDDVQVLEADSLDAARRQLLAHPAIDLLLLDLHLPDSHGLMGLAAVRSEFPAVAVLMVSAHDDPATVQRALAFGAMGFIPKRAGLAELQAALRSVLDCGDWLPPSLRPALATSAPTPHDRDLAARLAQLTPQQFRVLARVAEGLLNKQIADQLGISERTVKAHLSAIFDRLGVGNRTQAGVLLRTLELADPARRLDD